MTLGNITPFNAGDNTKNRFTLRRTGVTYNWSEYTDFGRINIGIKKILDGGSRIQIVDTVGAEEEIEVG